MASTAREHFVGGRFGAWRARGTRALLGSHFLSAWGDRMWEFGIAILLADLFESPIAPAAAFSVAVYGSCVLTVPPCGAWIDRQERLHAVRTTLLIGNVCVASTCALLALLTILPSSTFAFGLAFSLVVLLSCAAEAMGQAQSLAVSRDWIVQISGTDSETLTELNIAMQRIDLFAKVLAPALFGLALSAGNVGGSGRFRVRLGALLIGSWNVLSLPLELALTRMCYRAYTRQLAPKLHAHADGTVHAHKLGLSRHVHPAAGRHIHPAAGLHIHPVADRHIHSAAGRHGGGEEGGQHGGAEGEEDGVGSHHAHVHAPHAPLLSAADVPLGAAARSAAADAQDSAEAGGCPSQPRLLPAAPLRVDEEQAISSTAAAHPVARVTLDHSHTESHERRAPAAASTVMGAPHPHLHVREGDDGASGAWHEHGDVWHAHEDDPDAGVHIIVLLGKGPHAALVGHTGLGRAWEGALLRRACGWPQLGHCARWCAPASPASAQDGAAESPLAATARHWRAYFSHPVAGASVAFCLLFMTVLDNGTLVTSYLQHAGVSTTVLGLARTADAASGLLGTFAFPLLCSRLGGASSASGAPPSRSPSGGAASAPPASGVPGSNGVVERAGLISVWLFWATLAPAGVAFALKASESHAVLLGCMVLARAWLWSFDLAHTQSMQVRVEEGARGALHGCQASLSQLLFVAMQLCALGARRPSQFGGLLYLSLGSVLASAVLYSGWCATVVAGGTVCAHGGCMRLTRPRSRPADGPHWAQPHGTGDSSGRELSMLSVQEAPSPGQTSAGPGGDGGRGEEAGRPLEDGRSELEEVQEDLAGPGLDSKRQLGAALLVGAKAERSDAIGGRQQDE